MYAIVRTGGKQYRVERGQKLLVERLEAAEGADVKLEPLLFRSDDAVFDKDGLAGVQVTAKVLGHVRGEKLRVFKFKPKRGYKRRTGHRQELTQIEVVDISHGAKAHAKPRRKRKPRQRPRSRRRPRPRRKRRAESPGGESSGGGESAGQSGESQSRARGESRRGRESPPPKPKRSRKPKRTRKPKPPPKPKRQPNRKPKTRKAT